MKILLLVVVTIFLSGCTANRVTPVSGKLQPINTAQVMSAESE